MMQSENLSKTCILYVDDDRDNLESFKAVFRREYEVYLANSAKEAMAILRETTIHVLITDQRMPDMTGSELLERLAESYPDMLRYILTGFSDFDPLVHALNEGRLQGYFSKPLDPETIRTRIEDAMAIYHLKKENEGLFLSLQESEQRVRDQLTELEQVYSTAPVGLVFVDRELRIIRINEKLAEIDGLSVLEHLGRPLEEIVPNLIDQLRSVYQPVLDTGRPALNVPIHGTTRAQPGIERDWLGSYYPFTNNKGEITGVIGGVIEITELRRAERKVLQARRFTENLLQTANAMILVLDFAGKVKLINPKVEALTGYQYEELIGRDWFDSVVPKKDYPEVWQEFTRIMEGGSPRLFESPVLNRDGGKHTISWSNSVMKENGQPIGILSVGIDISERILAKEEKRRLARQLQQAQKMEAIGNLAGGIAHDFNNILSVILGFTELAIIDADPKSSTARFLHDVIAAGIRAKELVTQILTIARQTDEEFKPIRVNTIVREVLKFIRSSIPTSIDIQQQLSSDSLTMANATQLHQVFMNLCTNAAHAMGEDGGTLKVEVTDQSVESNSRLHREGLSAGEYITIRVSDTGIGIPHEIIGSIFEPYFTTKEPGEGTGIGLALVNSIIEKQGRQGDGGKPGGRRHRVYSLPADNPGAETGRCSGERVAPWRSGTHPLC